MIPPPSLVPTIAPTGDVAARDQLLLQKAQDLEAAFLSEMLAFTGLGETSDTFGGGAGEAQFASFLRQEQAEAMVRAGGIGLAESIFRALAAHADAG